MKKESFNRTTLLILTLAVTALFLHMIQGFLMAIIMAAIFTGLLHPLFLKFTKWFKGKMALGAMATILFFILIILIPVSGLLLIIVDQAISASEEIKPLLKQMPTQPDALVQLIEDIPIIHRLVPEHEKLVTLVENVVTEIGNFIVDGLSEFSSGTANFIFSLFIFLFTLYYFLIYGKGYLRKLLYVLPLKNEEESLLLSRFTTVTKATLKGTFLIGLIQGSLGAAGMAIAGISNVLFWGLIMTILSIVPALGPALVWGPASLYLIISGNTWSGIILALYGIVVIGNIDNLIRPKLVGKDAKIPDLMILFGTLGGLAVFGVPGIIIGPIIGSLFLTFWDIYGKSFSDLLYPVKDETIEREGK
jgi:predicted PurR-regulated permease PerM